MTPLVRDRAACRCPCTRGGESVESGVGRLCFPARVSRDTVIYESWRNPILLSPARSWTLGGRMVADSHTVLLGSPRHARPNPARAPRRRPIRSLPRAIMARVLGSAEQDGGALTRRALHALRRRRTLRCRCRHRPLRPRALIPFPWREACPAWWGTRDPKSGVDGSGKKSTAVSNSFVRSLGTITRAP